MTSSSDNSRVERLEALMAKLVEQFQDREKSRKESEAKMAEQLQTLTAAVANLVAPKNVGMEENGRRGETSKIAEELPPLDDDLMEYVVGRRAKSQNELQRLREQVETVTQKMKGKHEDLLDYNAMAFKEQLPTNFKMPEMAKFNGNGDPKAHLRQYVSLMSATGLSQNQVQKMFGMSLERAPVAWYHGLDQKIKDNWRALAEAFLRQYVTDMDIDVSIRDLENVRQRPEESFKEYMDRWKVQLMRMQNRPSERDQIKLIIRGTKPSIYDKIREVTSVIADFKQLKEMVMDIEEEEAEHDQFQGHDPEGYNYYA